MAVFDHSSALHELHGFLWRYVNENASVEESHDTLGDLLDLAPLDRDRLLAARVLTAVSTDELLTRLEELVPALPSTARLRTDELVGHVAGQVRWDRTMQRRFQSGDPALFVCARPERRYDTLQARTIKHSLDLLIGLYELAHVAPRGLLGTELRRSFERTEELRAHRKLREVTAGVIRIHDVEALAVRPHLAPVTAFLSWYDALFLRRDARAVLDAIERTFFAPTADFRLFELLVGFRLVRAFEDDLGWSRSPARRLLTSGRPIAELRKGTSRIRVWWQRSLWAILGGGAGALGSIVEASRSRIGAYRPDLLLEVDNGPQKRVLVGEVKLTGSDNTTPAEARGVLECLAYIRDAADYYSSVLQLPHGFVVAWGASGSPASSLVSIANEEQLTDLARVLVP